MAARVEFTALAQWLLGRAEALLFEWVPNGRQIGREWCVGDVSGIAGQSCRTNLDTGRGGDFASGQKWGDLIALYACVHGVPQLEAARELSKRYGYGDLESNVVPLRPAVSDVEPEESYEWPPQDAPTRPDTFRHRRWGLPQHVYLYRAPSNRLIYATARYELPDGKKEFSPWTWREGRWQAKGHGKPRPLYGLDRLEKYAGAVVLVEGEKCADALQGVTQRASVLSWAGGVGGWKDHDWSYLRGREVTLWPDADTAGFKVMQNIAGVLFGLGCTLRMVDIEGLPEKYDCADLIASGANVNQWLRPRIKPVQRPSPAPSSVLAPGPVPGANQGDVPSYSLAARYGLDFNSRGIHANLSNAARLIAGRIEEGAWSTLYYDEFLCRTMYGEPPREWADTDTLRMTAAMQREFQMPSLRKGVVDDAVQLYAFEHKRNALQEWLQCLHHDGRARIDELFVRGFGAVDTPYTRATAKCFMLGMVARSLKPGVQVDTLPVLEGEQGKRKSTALRALGGDYFTECHEQVTGKDFYMVLRGKMLVEIADFEAFSRSDVNTVKGVISNRVDTFRLPYAHRESDNPRACVFAATTNRDDWNRDETGARRFWPVECGEIDINWIVDNREQLFAEAVRRYRAGESWWDVPAAIAAEEQAKRRESDPLSQALRAYIPQHPIVNVAEFMGLLELRGAQRFDAGLHRRVVAQLRAWGYKATMNREGERVWSQRNRPKAPEQPEPDEPF